MSVTRRGATNVVDRLRAQAEERPEAVALVEGRGPRRRSLSFADLDDAGARGAAQLHAAGLRPGDAVLVLVPLSIRLYEVLASVFRAGLVAVIVDPGTGRAHVEASCRLRPPDAFVGSPKAHLLRPLVRGVGRIPKRFVTDGWVPFAERWGSGSDRVGVEPVGPEAPALLTFTSGTTGRPKAAVRTHGLLAAQHTALADALALAPGQVDLATLPVVVLANLASGVTTVLPDADLRRVGAFDPGPVVAQVQAERPTRCVASPAFFERLLDHAGPDDLVSFRRFDTGGAPVFPDLLARLARHAEAVGVYGSTEAEPVAHLAASDLTEADRRLVAEGGGLPVGRPVPQVEVRVIPDAWGTPLGPYPDADWDALRLGAGAVGEIVVAGDHVVPGYLHGQGDAETKVDVAGRRWHRTGDAGRLDPGGRLWLFGRCAAASSRASETVYPLQVEAALRERLGVRAAFVDIGGRRLVAVDGDADPEAVRQAVAWAHIEAVVRVAEIPRDRRHDAKVDLPALRELLRGR